MTTAQVYDTGALSGRLLAELKSAFGPAFTTDQLLRAIEHALLDLRGSVAGEALPEMALRLARHRLAAAVEQPSVA